MKTKEQIKEEFDKYELQEEVVKNKASLDAVLEITKDDLFENVRVTTKEKRANKIEKLKSRILNLFSFFTETENQIEIYDEDNEILDNFLEFCSQQNMFLTTMEEMSSDTNYQELARLYEFSLNYFNEILDYYDQLRDKLEYNYQGITFSGEKEDNKEAYCEFMEEELAHIRKEKNIVKTKKM